MSKLRTVLAASVLMLATLSAGAQDFRTGYFLGGYQYAYRMNPAFASEHNFVTVGLGQLGANINGDFGFSDLLKQNSAGDYVFFMDNSISSADALSGFAAMNNLDLSTSLNVLSFGKWDTEEHFFTTFDVAVRSTNHFSLPSDFFRLLKDGTAAGSSYDLSGTNVTSRNYLELAYGVNRTISNVVNFGARIKALVGLANASLSMEQLKVNMGAASWAVDAKGTLSGSAPYATFGTDTDGYYDFYNVTLNPSGLTKNLGFGGAVDAGLSVNILPWLTVSASLLDFGYVNWGDEILGEANYTSLTINPQTATGEGFAPVAKNLSQLYKFKPVESTAKILGSKWEQLPYRINAGAELRLPFYQRLSLGALYTMYNGNFTFNTNELLLSMNWTPLNFLSLSGSTMLGDAFKKFGAAINFHPGLINIFAGADVIPTSLINGSALFGKLIPSSVQPYVKVPAGSDVNLNAYVGLAINFGSRQLDYRKYNRSIMEDKKNKELAKKAEKLAEQRAKEAEKAAKEADKQAKIDAREAEKQAKIDAKNAEAQAKIDAKNAREAEKQAKLDEKAAKAQTKAAKAQAKAEAKAVKEAARKAKIEAKAAKFETEKLSIDEETVPAAAETATEVVEEKVSEAETILEEALQPAPEAEETAPAVEPAKEEPAPAEEPAKPAEPAKPTPAIPAIPEW